MSAKPKEPSHDIELAAAIASLPSAGATSDTLKTIGNMAFGKGCNVTAVKYYTQALGLGAHAPLDEAMLLSNRSAAYLRSPMVSGPSNALKDATRCCELRPSWFKSWTRLGDAYYAMKKILPEAKHAYKKAAEVCTQDDKVKDILESIRMCDGAAPPPPPPPQSKPKTAGEDKEWVFETVEEVRQVLAEDDARTARKHFAGNVADADREAAAKYRTDLLESFRKKGKKPADATEAAFERYNIRNYATLDKAALPEDFSRGTDYVGKAITNEALKGTVGGSWGDEIKGVKMKPK